MSLSMDLVVSGTLASSAALWLTLEALLDAPALGCSGRKGEEEKTHRTCLRQGPNRDVHVKYTSLGRCANFHTLFVFSFLFYNPVAMLSLDFFTGNSSYNIFTKTKYQHLRHFAEVEERPLNLSESTAVTNATKSFKG